MTERFISKMDEMIHDLIVRCPIEQFPQDTSVIAEFQAHELHLDPTLGLARPPSTVRLPVQMS
jgi:hypothetical protein